MHRTPEKLWRILGAPLAVAAAAALVLPLVVGAYWLQAFTAAVVYAVVALGLGILQGRVGLVSMGQIAILAIGGWTALRLEQAFGLPLPLLLVAVGLVTAVVGVLIGLPALRLSGLHLALMTLMLAAALAIVLTNAGFPTGWRAARARPVAARQRGPSETELGDDRRGVLPAHRARLRPPVRPGSGPSARPSGAGVGRDPAERVRGEVGRDQRDVLQARGLRPGLFHDRGCRRSARREQRRAQRLPVRPAGVDLLLAVVLMAGMGSPWGRCSRASS